jgi:integrase
VLSLLLDLAVRDGRIPRNPADRVPLPRMVRGEPRFLTRDEVELLADAAGEDGYVIRLLANTASASASSPRCASVASTSGASA